MPRTKVLYSTTQNAAPHHQKVPDTQLLVLHPADYVNENRKFPGRSWGCPALVPSESKYIIDSLKDGGLIYSFHPDYPLL